MAFEYAEGMQTLKADSLRKEFKTKNGRPVYSNGGITPDITTHAEEIHTIVQTLLQDEHITNFATWYMNTNPALTSTAGFYLTEENYTAFTDHVKKRGLNYLTETEVKLTAFRETAQKEGYWQVIQSDFEQLENRIKSDKEKDLSHHKDLIKKALEEEIAYLYFGQKGRFEVKLRDDKEVKKAVEILMDPMAYNGLLHSGNK